MLLLEETEGTSVVGKGAAVDYQIVENRISDINGRRSLSRVVVIKLRISDLNSLRKDFLLEF